MFDTQKLIRYVIVVDGHVCVESHLNTDQYAHDSPNYNVYIVKMMGILLSNAAQLLIFCLYKTMMTTN